jgi:hypothetical protein
MDFAELCDEAWDSSLDVAADCVEAYARVRDTFCDVDPCEDACRPRGRGGDFLYELLHLNVTYAMQLARLGSSYSVYAHRAIGALYGLYAAPKARRSKGLWYTGVSQDQQTRVIRVTNFSDEKLEAKAEFENLRSRDGYEINIDEVRTLPQQAIEPGRTVKIGVQMVFPGERPGRYCGTLRITLGKQRKAIPVVVCIERPGDGRA